MTQNQALTKPTNRAVTGMSQTLRYGFLLAPDFTLIALSAALEPLRMANRISGGNLYEFPLFSLSGDPVQSSSGIVVHPTTVLNGDEPLDAVFLCAGTSLDPAWDRLILDQIRPLLRRRITIGGICTGSYLLARNGLLDGYRKAGGDGALLRPAEAALLADLRLCYLLLGLHAAASSGGAPHAPLVRRHVSRSHQRKNVGVCVCV